MNSKAYHRIDFVSKIFFVIALVLLSLFYLQSILAPLVFSMLVALVLLPLCQKFESWGIHRILSILLALFLVAAVTVALGILLSSQLNNFLSDLPDMKEKVNKLLEKMFNQVESVFNVSEQEQLSFLRKNSTEMMKSGSKYITTALGATTSFISFVTLVPVYCFLLLYYRDRFRKAFLQMVPQENQDNALKIYGNSKQTIQQYVVGLVLVVGIIAVLNITGLLLLGIKYAFFLGLFSALLTIVPYVGVIVGGLIPFLVALVTKDNSWYAVGVVGMYWFVQIVEGNFITPRVMGSQVNLNALAIIFGLVAGGRLWGLMGMVLAVPIIAILKVICTNIEGLKPFATLLGNKD